MQTQNKGTCFVIAPIGEEGTDIRRRSDQVLKHIITPAANDCGYHAFRADTISEPGLITSQVIQHLLEDPLVIADLTGRNPNVFYELAVRNAVRKPCVQIIQRGEQIPFDVYQSRTIQVDHNDLDSVAYCKEELIKQFQSVERITSEIDTPITVAIDLQALRQSDNPLEKSSAEIISIIQELNKRINEISSLLEIHLKNDSTNTSIFSPTFKELKTFIDNFNRIFDYEKLSDDKHELINEIKTNVSNLIISYLFTPKLKNYLNQFLNDFSSIMTYYCEFRDLL